MQISSGMHVLNHVRKSGITCFAHSKIPHVTIDGKPVFPATRCSPSFHAVDHCRHDVHAIVFGNIV